MDTTFNALNELDRAGALLLHRHFVYVSGKHGSGYINMDPIFPNVVRVMQFCEALVLPFKDDPIATIAAPAVGGVVLASFSALAARRLTDRVICGVWADKSGTEFVFERAGFVQELDGENVLIVEDLLTTGGSVKRVIEEVEMHNGNVIGVSVIVNRGGVTAEGLGVRRLEALAEVNFDAIDEEACPLCESEVPIVEDIGHGAAYKAEHPDYPGGYIKLLS